jgi:hypothetical protein
LGGLKREFARFITRREDPAAHELWVSLSEAIHELRKKQEAWRLDDPTDESPNHNAAVWTQSNTERGQIPYDLERFERATESIETFYPPGARRWYEDGQEPKIISPANAKKLLTLLLTAADGAISFHDLFDAAKRKVFVLKQVDASDGVKELNAEQTVAHPDAQKRLLDEASRRAALIWDQLKKEGLTNCLCTYFLPKYLLGEKVTLPEPTSTSGDQVTAIKAVLAKELRGFSSEDSGAAVGSGFSELVNGVAEELFAHCRKNGEMVPSREAEIKHEQT